MEAAEKVGGGIAPRKGDIWVEMDPRSHCRFVKISEVGDRAARLYTVERGPDGWEAKRGCREGWADLGRFTGKRGGYMLHARGDAV